MTSGGETTRTSGPSALDVRREVARLLAAPELAHAARLASLLRFVVEETLRGRADTLKEARIGLDVFGRRPDSYDPAIDPIVRVQMGRLRAKLRSHYSRAPGESEIHIDIPPGRYVPTFQHGTSRHPPSSRQAPWRQTLRRIRDSRCCRS